MTSEQDLLRKAHRFESDALAEIYDSFSSGIYRYALRLLGEGCMAEDCVAETFSRFLLALKNGGGPKDHLKAYLYRIAHNYITDLYRRAAPIQHALNEEILNDQEETPQAAMKQIEKTAVRSALQKLTSDQRLVVELKFIEGWDNEAIARIVGKPVSAVKALQHRALASLRRMLVIEEESI